MEQITFSPIGRRRGGLGNTMANPGERERGGIEIFAGCLPFAGEEGKEREKEGRGVFRTA